MRASDPDPIIDEMIATQRDRRYIVIPAVVGILAGAVCGVGFSLGLFGRAASGATGTGNPASLIFFVGPLAVCMGLGYALHAIVSRLRPDPARRPVRPDPGNDPGNDALQE